MNDQTMNVLIQGASRGIGLEFVRQLGNRADVANVVATCRNPSSASELRALQVTANLHVLAMDIEHEHSIRSAAGELETQTDRLDLLINCAGLLHDASGLAPERRLEQLDADNFHRSFAVNAIGPALVVKHFHRLLRAGKDPMIVNMSARVGSITDNRLGGWYAYRASKAAQNMLTRCMAIELGRGSQPIAVVALHPGTVDTDLSKPFHRNVPDKQLFSVNKAVSQLLDVIDGLDAGATGGFYAWDGSAIDW